MREDKSTTTTMEYGYSDDQDLLDEIMRDYACYAREYDPFPNYFWKGER